MQQRPIGELTPNMPFEGFLLVRTAKVCTDKNGKPYVDMNLADRTGEVNCKNWNASAITFDAGSIVKVRGGTREFNGRLQLNIEKIRAMAPTDDVDMNMLAPCAPRSPEEMLREITDTVEAMESPALKELTGEMIRRFDEKLRYYPAAQRIHHAERGGLLHHTTGMLRLAKTLVPLYPFVNRDLLYAGVILHDICKTEEMDSDRLGIVKDYSREGLLLGHLVLGVTRIQQAADDLHLDGEEILLLQHMMLSHHGEPEWGSPRKPMFAEAELLHWIDLLDARMNEMQACTAKVAPGAFTDKIWSLDRRLYRPEFTREEEEAEVSVLSAEDSSAYI